MIRSANQRIRTINKLKSKEKIMKKAYKICKMREANKNLYKKRPRIKVLVIVCIINKSKESNSNYFCK